MGLCKNCRVKKYYSGKEPSPKGLGYCASCMKKAGMRKKGRDGKYWITSRRKNGSLFWKRVSKGCPKGKIRNPKTGRCVMRNGIIGRKLRGIKSTKKRVVRKRKILKKRVVRKRKVLKICIPSKGICKPVTATKVHNYILPNSDDPLKKMHSETLKSQLKYQKTKLAGWADIKDDPAYAVVEEMIAYMNLELKLRK